MFASALALVTLIAATSEPLGTRTLPRFRLEYVRGEGAEGCLAVDQLREEIAARLGVAPFHEPAEQIIALDVELSEGHLEARLSLRSVAGEAMGNRVISASSHDCAELTQALILAISLAIDPMNGTHPTAVAPSPQPPPPAPAPVADTGPHLEANLGPVVSMGMAPQVAFGALLGVEVHWSRFSLGLEGRADLPAGVTVSAAGGSAQTSLIYGALVACARISFFGGCGLVAVGTEQSKGTGLIQPGTVVTPYSAVGARVLAELHVVGPVWVTVHADLVAPLARTEVEVGSTVVWSSFPVGGSLGVSVAIQFL